MNNDAFYKAEISLEITLDSIRVSSSECDIISKTPRDNLLMELNQLPNSKWIVSTNAFMILRGRKFIEFLGLDKGPVKDYHHNLHHLRAAGLCKLRYNLF